MKLDPSKRNEPGGPLVSEGKTLEIFPIITDAWGQPYALPPVIWKCPNWLLGFRDNHTVSFPITFHPNDRIYIPGTIASESVQLSFMVRLMEDSPDSAPVSGSVIDAETVSALVDAFRKAQNDA